MVLAELKAVLAAGCRSEGCKSTNKTERGSDYTSYGPHYVPRFTLILPGAGPNGDYTLLPLRHSDEAINDVVFN